MRNPTPVPTCPFCGSAKVIQDTRVQDQGQHSDGILRAYIGNQDPDAYIFKEPVRSELRVNICCACGRVDIRVQDPGKLWDIFQHLPEQKRP